MTAARPVGLRAAAGMLHEALLDPAAAFAALCLAAGLMLAVAAVHSPVGPPGGPVVPDEPGAVELPGG